jgi:hypothetical protein
MRYESEGLQRWANTDTSRHTNVIARDDRPDWRVEYVRLLKAGDYAAAHDLRMAHDRKYAKECK